MKGIILAGGSGTRLYPITKGISKQLLPIYNKPMIYYPLSTLMLAGIKEILIISTPEDLPLFKRLLGDGNDIGIKLEYAEQAKPNGLAEAFIIGKDFIGSDNVAMILGDNIFYGAGLSAMLRNAVIRLENENKPSIFAYYVSDPSRYGVAVLEGDKLIGVEEKPENPKSNYAIVGLYFYKNDVVDIAPKIKPSKRGELEITSINQYYIDNEELYLEKMQRGMTWLDTGTHESLYEAAAFVEAIEKRQGLKIAAIEEIAYRNGWIDDNRLRKIAEPMSKNEYGQYLLSLID